ncbi:hypothetical protein D3C85_1663100 [compost metagenome]
MIVDRRRLGAGTDDGIVLQGNDGSHLGGGQVEDKHLHRAIFPLRGCLALVTYHITILIDADRPGVAQIAARLPGGQRNDGGLVHLA